MPRISLLVSMLLAAVASAASARPLAVVIHDRLCDLDCDLARRNLREVLLSEGLSVAVQGRGLEDGDLDDRACAFDIRVRDEVQPEEVAVLGALLERGGGAYLGGENIFFDARNRSVTAALNALGAGGVQAYPDRPTPLPTPGEFPEDANPLLDPPHPLTLLRPAGGPAAPVIFDGVGVGWFLFAGRGDTPLGLPGSSPMAAWGSDRGGVEDLPPVPDGRLVSILDLNWLSTTFGSARNREQAGSIAAWLCGGPEGVEGPVEPRCTTRTRGFWRRQCSGDEAGRPEALASDWSALRAGVDRFLASLSLPQLRLSTRHTCDALEPDPDSDPCERALAQATAYLLNVRYGLVSCDCPFDAEALAAEVASRAGLTLPSGLDAVSLADYLFLLLQLGHCTLVNDLADGLNQGRSLTDYQGEGDVTADGRGGRPRSRLAHPRWTSPDARRPGGSSSATR